MEWQQLEYFQAVAKLQHFTRAAEQLSISQPTLSRSIANLEAELGVPLFDREGRGIRLNRYGEKFSHHVTRALQEIQNGKEALEHWLDPEYGTVALSFLKSLGISTVPNLISEFLQQAPHIRFQLFQHSTNLMLDQLEREEVDYVLSSMTESRRTVEWCYLWQEDIFAYVPEGHRLAQSPAIDIKELAEESFIAIKQGYGLRTISDRLFEQANVTPNITFEGDEVVTVTGFIAAGLGVSLLPIIPGLEQKKVVRIPITNPDCRRMIGLAWKKDGYQSPAAERFKSFLLARYRTADKQD